MQSDTEQPQNPTEDGADEKLGARAEVENLGACKRRIKASVPAEKVQEQLDRSYKELAGVVRLPGFRPGRVPRRLLEARYGEELENDLEASLKATSFAEITEDNGLRVIGAPTFDKVKFEHGQDFEYEVEVEVRPEFELPRYKGLEVERNEKPATDEDVADRIEAIRKRDAERIEIEPSEGRSDDMFIGKYTLSRDGQVIKENVDAMFRPSSDVLDEFRIEGLAARVDEWDRPSGTPLAVRVSVPQGYADEALRGVELELSFKLEKVLRLVYPEVNDEWAKKYGAESLDHLRSTVRESLAGDRRRAADREVEDHLLDMILEATTMDMPETLLEGERKRVQREREQELLRSGMAPEDVKEKLVAEGDQVLDDLRRELKRTLVLSEIADKEKIFITEAQVAARMRMLAELYGIPPAALKSEFDSSGRTDELRLTLRHERTREFLRRKAKVKNIGESPEESEGGSSATETAPAGGAEPENVEDAH